MLDAAAKRTEMLRASQTRLLELADRAISVRGLGRHEFVMVCIQVDDPGSRDIVDQLMPNVTEEDWQKYRDQGEEPVAIGSAAFSLCEVLRERLPNLTSILMEIPPEGQVKTIVMAEGGASIYNLELGRKTLN